MTKISGKNYDFIMFVRPDVKLLNEIDLLKISKLNIPNNMILWENDDWHGLSDKFSIMRLSDAEILSNNYENFVLEFKKYLWRI